ncbi:polynucleotide adenylyltransferase/metal dependent phosphohydrolase [Oscillochloris trichoides DG-6]|uniref:Polynucleotide adenylyltransferase/metal dependent phosphohydrolase n=1 Tax=Oscillochloris trichoides DG-6 TaxID=765420 RepID=E1IAR4_9CHLR|nr:HD domain-containing protein [Oscillochloris trichoides]EFO81743.1 polynucleotide adenylyltransferase/metal dependent phosphohydrolase [Oscillochloris trichoides DG-6]
MLPTNLVPIFTYLADFFAQHHVPAWLIGGTSRDLLRGVEPTDLDLAVDGDGLELARTLADQLDGSFVPLDGEHCTGRTVLPARANRPALYLDIARLRAPSIDGDLRLRDFTINALALPLTRQLLAAASEPDGETQVRTMLLDPTGGLADLQAGILRTTGPASMADDPLRILRAPRFAATLNLRPAPELATQIRAAAPGLSRIAGERLRDELLKLLETPSSATWLDYLDACGVLTILFPELEAARTCNQPRVHFLPVLAHMLETVACLEWIIQGLPLAPNLLPATTPRIPVAVQTHPDLSRAIPYPDAYTHLLSELRSNGRRRLALLKLATLIHDNAKPQTKQIHPDGKVSFYGHQELGAEVAMQITKRLRMSRQDSAYISLIVREHMRPGQLRASEVLTPRAVVRFFRDTGDAGPDVLLHELADHMATRGPNLQPEQWAIHRAWIRELLDVHWGRPIEQRQPLLGGNDLMRELQIAPGPQVGRLLRTIGEAQASGEIGSYAEALELARRMLQESEDSSA